MTPPSFRNILIVRNDRMGDLLMTLPALHAVRLNLPKAKVTLVLDHRWVPLCAGHPDCDEMLPWNERQGRGWLATFHWAGQLRAKNFDCAFVMNPSRLFHVATFLAGIPTRVGLRRKWGFLLSHGMPDTKAQRPLHETRYNLELLQLVGIETEEPHLMLPVSPEGEIQAREILARAGLSPSSHPVAVHPFTSNLEKAWPLKSFRKLCTDLETLGETVVLVGESEGTCAAFGAVDLSGKVPLKLLPALLRCCKVLVSNDSGPVHVAAAVGTPTVVVAPREHAALLSRWRPLGEGHSTLLSPTPEEVVRLLQEHFLCES